MVSQVKLPTWHLPVDGFFYQGPSWITLSLSKHLCHPVSYDCLMSDTLDLSPGAENFSRQESWSGLPFPPPGDPPDPGTEPTSSAPPALAGGFLVTESLREPIAHGTCSVNVRCRDRCLSLFTAICSLGELYIPVCTKHVAKY